MHQNPSLLENKESSTSNNLEKDIKKITIIAGNGNLVSNIIDLCQKKNIEVFLIPLISGKEWGPIPKKIYKYGSYEKFLKYHKCYDSITCGGLPRHNLMPKYIIKKSFSNFSKKISIRNFILSLQLILYLSTTKHKGDDSMLSRIISFLEKKGLRMHSINKLFPELTACEGNLGAVKMPRSFKEDIDFGIKVAKTIGNLDIGQSVIIQKMNVVGVEAIEGTDKLLLRCKDLMNKEQRKGILVKIKKPVQDSRMDLPAIGIKTIENAHNCGLAGIVLDVGNTLIIDKKEVIKKLNEYKMFAYGVKV